MKKFKFFIDNPAIMIYLLIMAFIHIMWIKSGDLGVWYWAAFVPMTAIVLFLIIRAVIKYVP